MKPLFGAEGRRVLRQFAWSNVLLAFDFDGTLAPIVLRPADARMRPSTAARLRKVSELYPCAVLSGRARADVGARLGEARVKAVVGNHGLEPGTSLRGIERLVRAWVSALEPLASAFPGVNIEDKRYSVAIHFRGVRNKREALGAINEVVQTLGPVRQIDGKQVLNLVPPDAPHKGDALVRVRERVGAQTAIYFGDDATDEDVFAIADPGHMLPIRVGRRKDSLAWYFIPRQPDIDAVLDILIAEREAFLEVYS